MPITKIADQTIRLILNLKDQNKNPDEIANILRLKPIHVRTILAAHQTENLSIETDSQKRTGPDAGSAELEPLAALRNRPILPVVQESDPCEKEDDDEVEKIRPDAIYIGEDEEYSGTVYWEPTNKADVPNPHLMIMGESGSGKTYSTQCLIAELAQKNIPSIVFDYSQSFEVAHLEKPFLKFSNVKEHVLGDTGLPINPLQVFPNDPGGPKRVAARVSDVFDAVYHLGDIQRRVVIDGILGAFRRAGMEDADSGTWNKLPPTLGDLQVMLDDLSADKSYANAKNATGVSARMITFFMLGCDSNAAWSWDDLLNDSSKVHILQFRGLEGKTQRVLVELLLWHLFYFLKNRGQHPLNLFCVLDEAHHLSFRESGPVDSLLREARKFGLGVIFASQQPEDFSPAAFSNTASKLVFQITDPMAKVSRALAAKCSNYQDADDIKRIVSQQKQGHALFVTKNKGFLVRVADFRKRATLWQHQ
jgi:DNA phosphorothioation-dependent restriction protein DptH